MGWVAALLIHTTLAGAPDLPGPTLSTVATATVAPAPSFSRWARDDEDIETEGREGPVMGNWWFWAIMGTVAAGIVTTGVVITQKDEFVPQGELGITRTDRDWTSL